MIYGLLGCPSFGVRGAAYATVIGQIASCIVGLFFHLRVNKQLKNGLHYIKPSLGIIGAIYAIGLPAIIAQALMSLMTYGLNVILGGLGEAMVTAYGLYYKIQQFVLFAAFGLRDAITPVVSYSHGMGNRERIRDGIKYGMLFTLIIMCVGLVAIEVFAAPFSGFFGLSGETKTLCIAAMRIISVSFIFAGVNIAFQGIFQALDGGIESLIVSLCRQLVFIFPFAWLFAYIAKRNMSYSWMMWVTFPIAELLSAVIAVLLFKRIYGRLNRTWEGNR
jgi:Na+-driven multidrug efflux pump